MHLTELAGSSRLLLVTVICRSDLCNGLAVGDARSKHVYLNLVLVLESPLYDVYMMLSLSLEDGLLKFLRIFHYDCRVFGSHLVQGLGHLLLVLLLLSLNCSAELGLREIDRLERYVSSRSAQGHICLCCTELHGTSDISCEQVADPLFLLSGHGIDSRNPLLVTGLRILKVHSFRKLTGHDLEICHLAKMRLNGSLIYEQ